MPFTFIFWFVAVYKDKLSGKDPDMNKSMAAVLPLLLMTVLLNAVVKLQQSVSKQDL